MSLSEFKAAFDPLFINYLQKQLEIAVPQYFTEEKNYILSLARHGKRIRPYVAYLASNSATLEKSQFLTLFYSLELFHLFALIHDDIIDNSPERRGMKSFHELLGKSSAILWGDLCFSLAFQAVSTAAYPKEARALFSQMASQTIFGQMLDTKNDSSLRDLVIDLKTARYTFLFPILLGLSVSKSQKSNSQYVSLGLLLGRAFQRLDDLSDREVSVDMIEEEKLHLECELLGASEILNLLQLQKERQDEWHSLIDLFRQQLIQL